MKPSVALLAVLASAVAAVKPKFLNSNFNVIEGQAFILEYTGCTDGCTIVLQTGPSTGLQDVQTISNDATGGEFSVTLQNIPTNTYNFKITNNASGSSNYSPQFQFKGTAPPSSSAASSSAAKTSSTAVTSSAPTSASTSASSSAPNSSTKTTASTKGSSTSVTSSPSSTAPSSTSAQTPSSTTAAAGTQTSTVPDGGAARLGSAPAAVFAAAAGFWVFFN